MGHILRRHRGNNAVPPEKSRADEREADEFALRVLRRDQGQVPMGAILYFQMTAFTTGSPQRFDFPTIEEWQEKLRTATHPLTSNRVLGLAKGLRDGADQYGRNREIAKDIADKLDKFAQEYDDRDWQLYFKRIGERAPLSQLRPRKE
jgi:predicted Zn-dependent protease